MQTSPPLANPVPPCGACGGEGIVETVAVAKETRWRVRCGQCGHMTMAFLSPGLALAVWTDHFSSPPTR